MDDPLPVGAVEGLRDLDPVAEGLRERKGALPQALVEALALQVLHDQEVDPVLPADVVEDTDVGVVEGGDGAGLTLEALPQRRAPGEVGGKDLDGDGPVEARVPRAIDLAHAAGAERSGDLVRAEPRARIEGHRLSPRCLREHLPDEIRALVSAHETFHLRLQLRIPRAGLRQEGPALTGVTADGRMEQVVKPLPALGNVAGRSGRGHAGCPAMAS